MPGMNAEVEIQIASRESVAVVPTMALRADSDIPAASMMLGLEEAALRAVLGRPAEAVAGGLGRASWPDGRTGASAVAEPVNGRSRTRSTEYEFGGDYWVVALRDGQLVPVAVRTGVTDLEYSEVITGLAPGEEVLLLPSTSLFEQQEALQRFIAERFSSSPFQQQPQRGGRFR